MKTLSIENKEVLGQVLTSQEVAKLMVELVKPHLGIDSECFDPCIGANVFFNELSKHNHKRLVGVEIDKDMVDGEVSSFFDKEDRQLIVADFFNMNIDRNKFDVIIMNPPYVRHELLNCGVNSKHRIFLSLGSDYKKIPGKSNLYVYFLLKALKHLKDKGKLVAIIYDSWLFTEYGRIFKDVIFNKFSLEKIIHFRRGAFENVNVGATIILLGNDGPSSKVEYYSFNSPADMKAMGGIESKESVNIPVEEIFNINRFHGNSIDFSNELFTPLSTISKKPINRGVNALVNEFFLFTEDRFKPYTHKIIKEVAKIKKFEVSNEYKYLLMLREQPDSKAISDYLRYIKDVVNQNPESFQSLRNRIAHDPTWFSNNGSANGSIIFNYYMRDNIHFIHNPKRYLVADNFYNLYVAENNIYAYLSILNSTITKLSLLLLGKSQGRGLFKIQLGRFRKVPILDAKKLSMKTLANLENLGRKLAHMDRSDSKGTLKKIDELLLNEINVHLGMKLSLRQLEKEIKNLIGVIT
jgi:hypothetical protein